MNRLYALKSTILLVLIILLTLTCNNNPIKPDEDKPGRRDYVWEIDTIDTPFSMLRDIFGTSPQDVWTIAGGGDKDKKIFHFDGEKWTNDPNAIPYQPESIYGFSTTNVWIGGGDGKIWHFDGGGWSEFTTLNVVPGKGINFGNVWGEKSNDVYATGAYTDDSLLFNNGVIAHFNGSKWNILHSFNNSGSIVRFYKSISNQYPLVYIWHFDYYGDSTFIYRLNQGMLQKFHSGSFGYNSYLTLNMIGDRIFILKGKEIFEYENDQLKFFLSVDLPDFRQGFFGRTKNDIFLLMNDGIAHYNGTDIQYIYNFDTKIIFGRGIFFDKDVFIILAGLGQGGRNFILRGKLN
jgi:hypothetical protein